MQREWNRVPTIPPLDQGEVQVWRLDLAAVDSGRVIASASRMLVPSELERASRIRLDAARNEFIAGRGLLRMLVAPLAHDVALEEGANGKPKLPGTTGLEFNVSHSGGMILVAVSKAGPVGVDVETVDPAFAGPDELLEIARSSFDATQLEGLERAEGSRERLLEFYRAWTRKEAVAKADGRGIAESVEFAFEKIATSGEPGCDDCYLASLTKNAQGLRSEFFVQGLGVGAHHAGSLATVERNSKVNLYLAADLL